MFKFIGAFFVLICIIDDAVLIWGEISRFRPRSTAITREFQRARETSFPVGSYIKGGRWLLFPSFFVEASSGDVDPSFRECVWYCKMEDCKEDDMSIIQRHILKWECIDECQYNCMRNISDHYLKVTGRVPKYYGHWPFIRVFLMQEPAAALFSIANIIPHAYYIRKYWNTLASSSSNVLYGKFLIILSFISMNAWLASVAYHTRKLPATALYDFSSALILLGFSTGLAAYRLSLELKLKTQRSFDILFGVFSVFLMGFTLFSILNLYHGSIAFGDHMKRCIGLATSQLTLWIIWFLVSKAPHRYWCLLSQVWFAAAGMLEVFDFPPYFGHFDAHSLWHAATVPLGMILYHFWIQDVYYLNNCLRDGKTGETSERCNNLDARSKVD
jgi:hypothetical protein